MTLAAIGSGFLIGAAIGMLGGGGSVLAVPLLVYGMGESVAAATTASLVVVTAGALAGGLRHHLAGRVCWRHVLTFAGGAIPGILAGTAAGDAVSGGVVLASFAVVMLTAAALTWRNTSNETGDGDRPGGCPPLRLGRDAALGLGVGLMTGFFGVGGGFLVVPTLAIVLAFSMRLAVGTSVAIVTITSMIGLAVHLMDGRSLDLPLTAAMAASCAAGALGGAALAGRAAHDRLGQAFAVFVVLVAAYLLAAAVLGAGPVG